MKVLIIEDEPAAAKRLTKLLVNIEPSMEIIACIDSVEDAVTWFEIHEEPDIAFFDIQLSDGLCFEIFEEIQVDCPVVFTTAYEEYAIRAFKVNSIDYLLKPINPEELKATILKYNRLTGKDILIPRERFNALLQYFDMEGSKYKSRFLIKTGDAYVPVPCKDVSYFCVEDQLIRLITKEGMRHVIDHSLDELETVLDPNRFHRINRQMIVAWDSIKSVHTWFNSRLKLELNPPYTENVIVSRTKAKNFRLWLEK